MKKTILFALLFLLLVSFNSQAQFMGAPRYGGGPSVYGNYGPSTSQGIIAINSGTVLNLAGVKHVNIIYGYADLSVGTFRKEEDYLKQKQEEYKNAPDKFERFKQNWFGFRKNYFEPEFQKQFNKYGIKAGITGINYTTEHAVTLKVDVAYMETVNGSVDMQCTFVDKDGKELLRYFIKNVAGSESAYSDYETYTEGTRLAASYGKAAKMLMKDLKKRLKELK